MFITSGELPARMNEPNRNAPPRMTMPARMVFLRPILEATAPTGMYETMAAPVAMVSVVL